jgi:signal transduction histidine kinase
MSGWLDIVAAVVAAAVAVAAAVTVWRAGFRRWPLAAAVIVSITVTLALRPPPGYVPSWTVDLLLMLVEWCAFAMSIVRVVHRESRRTAVLAAAAGALAMSMLVLRLIDLSSWPAAQACVVWTVSVVPAVALGLMLRAQARQQARLVIETRRRQQLRLARDLHDFVAHDVSEILATAQAGNVIGATDPARAASLFQRIEDAGQRAMSSLDRTVHMLHETGADTAGEPGPHVADLPGLVANFDAAGSTRCRLDLDPAVTDTIAPAVGAVVYRVVAEGLTNVRRHAPDASAVTVTVAPADDRWLVVTVANDVTGAGHGRPTRARGGRGIAGLRKLVEAAGGQVVAGPRGGTPGRPDGRDWHLVAMIPSRAVP